MQATGAEKRHSTYTEQDGYGCVPGGVQACLVDTFFILVHVLNIAAQRERTLDRLKSTSKDAANEAPICMVPMHAPQTIGEAQASSACEVECQEREGTNKAVLKTCQGAAGW